VEPPSSRDQALALDASDPIARYREGFALPEGVIYLDGNSLGPPPRSVFERINTVLQDEWGEELIRAWTNRGWIDLPERVASAIAGLIGARSDEVMVADSTSVNLFKLLGAALQLRPGRSVVLTEDRNFGTDLYVAQGLVDAMGEGVDLRVVDRGEIVTVLGDDVAVLMLTHVDFRTGEMHDMETLTRLAHETGALVLWDLAHSAGAVAVDLGACSVDLAVGCGYKYLNGGPGAPAFAYVARRHHDQLKSPLWGWMGHRDPFDFEVEYRPATGVGRLRVGTPQILGLAALECGVDSVAAIGVNALRSKSVALTECFLHLVGDHCSDHGFEVASPLAKERRGSQVSLRHPDGYSIMQALIAEGVIGDFREPDLMRFGFAPAYVRFVDVWDAVETLAAIMDSGTWDRPEFQIRAKVT
jgi:kynureninase